jgi:AraC-like DNA-binding protein/mannose-6-phosphate isomerase-like protein (cupin superfamily)
MKGGIEVEQEQRTVCYDKELSIEAYRFKGIMQKFPNHFHEHYVIGFIESGNRCLTCKNKEYIIRPGDLVMFNPLDNHTCEQFENNPLDYRCINIKPDVMKKVVREVTGKEYLPQFTETVGFHSDYVALLRELHQAIMEEQQEFKKEETFLFLIEQLIEEYTKPSIQAIAKEVNMEINKICEYIDMHYPEHLTLDDLSKIANMNKYSLLRAFTRERGITPYRYLETVRINEAKKLLEKGIEPINVAMKTGFVDQSHLTNYFKEFIGLTPKQYQKIFIENDK